MRWWHRSEAIPLDPELRRRLGIITAHLLDEPLGVLAADENLQRVTEREVGREGVVDDGVDDHQAASGYTGVMMTLYVFGPGFGETWIRISSTL